MALIRLTDGVHALNVPFAIPMAPGRTLPRFVYVYLLRGARVLLIDGGVAGAESAILDAVAQIGGSTADVATLLLTHSHPDHIGAAAALHRRTACRILAHAAERPWIEDTERQQRERPVPGFTTLVGGNVPVSAAVHHGEALAWPPLGTLQILHTPGHSPGSLSIWLPEERVLFTGDAVPQPGTMPIYTDVLASAASLRLLLSLERVSWLCSSWDDPRHGEGEVRQALMAGLAYLAQVHAAVVACAPQAAPGDPLDLCRAVVARLGLPALAANPLVATSIEAHRRLIGDPRIEKLLYP